jgi:hypothetical protein
LTAFSGVDTPEAHPLACDLERVAIDHRRSTNDVCG